MASQRLRLKAVMNPNSGLECLFLMLGKSKERAKLLRWLPAEQGGLVEEHKHPVKLAYYLLGSRLALHNQISL